MTQPPTESFVATFETCLDVANLALASGDKPRAQRALHSAIQALSDRADMRRELLATMVRLGNVELEMDAAATARTTFREAVAIGEAALGSSALELIPAFKGLASASVSVGALDDARMLVARASEIADRQPDAAQGAFAELLNDVSRFYFRQGAHADAEPLLQRLLVIKRAKGDEHPEVATVTASLATTRQALGRYESAEQLWRKVLAIRERTLAPSHFSLATTLEHLADCCAARGKLAEALRLSERALVIREVALGTEHPSVRALRERIGDMRLQAAEESVDATAPLARLSPPLGLVPELWEDPQAAMPAMPATPAVLLPPPLPNPEPAMLPAPASLAMAPVPIASGSVAPPSQQFQSVLLDIQRDIELDEAPAPIGFLGALRGYPAALRERRPAAIVGTSAAVVTMAGALAFGFMNRSGGMEWVVDETARQQGAPIASYSVPAPTLPTVPQPQDSIAPAKAAPPTSTARRSTEERSEKSSRPTAAEPEVPVVSRPVIPALGSVVSDIEVPRTNLDAISAQRPVGDATKALAAAAGGTQRIETRARMLGALPTPRYPQQLNWAGVGGEVRVQFEVDTLGRPVLGTFRAVGSPNPLLVDAVRKVITPMRFEPARSPWPESRPMADQVELAFHFKPRGRN